MVVNKFKQFSNMCLWFIVYRFRKWEYKVIRIASKSTPFA